jgi:uncharacterized protein
MSARAESTEIRVSLPAAPRLSAEVFLIPLEAHQAQRYIVYAPLRRAAFIANARYVNLLADIQQGRCTVDPEAPELELLRELGIIDAEPEERPSSHFAGEPKPTNLTLFMTTACNLRCTYCYAAAGETPLRSMSLATACRGIDFVAANAAESEHRKFAIVYHGGGEPTVNWSVLTESFEYGRRKSEELGLHFTAASATNGVLRDDQTDWIIEHLSGGVSLSFDGLPEMHDRHRLTVAGQGSSERVLRTMRRFEDADYPYGVRITVTHDNIARLPEALEFTCSQFHPARIQVEPAYQIGRWENAPAAETEAFIAAYREAREVAQRHGQNITYSAARLDVLTSHFCGVTQDTFALSPDGNVSACYEIFSEDHPFADLFFYGRSEEKTGKFLFNLPVLDSLREQTVDHRSFCNGCFARWHCAGDCLHKSLSVNGRVQFAGSQRCHITRELTKDLILEGIAASGGLVWHEPDEPSPPSMSQGKELFA